MEKGDGWLRNQDESKGVPNILGTNLAHFLRIFQVTEHASLPPVCKSLADVPNFQHLTTLQRAFDNATQRLSIRAPIVAIPVLLNMTLTLGFSFNHRENLCMGFHQFCLGYHTSSTRKVLQARFDQHLVIAGSGGAPTLAGASYLKSLNGVSFPKMVSMARSAHAHLWMVLDTLI